MGQVEGHAHTLHAFHDGEAEDGKTAIALFEETASDARRP
jgi:hypothetical protein